MLYQQVQKIEVVVRRAGGGGAIAGANETEAGETSQAENAENKSAGTSTYTARRRKRIIITNTTHILAVAKQVANLAMNERITTIGIRNGDEALQENVQRQWEVFQDRASIASSFVMGAVYGAWGGLPGAVIGAITNTTSTVVSIGAKYRLREKEYSAKLFKEQNGINYLRARASVNLTTGRLR